MNHSYPYVIARNDPDLVQCPCDTDRLQFYPDVLRMYNVIKELPGSTCTTIYTYMHHNILTCISMTRSRWNNPKVAQPICYKEWTVHYIEGWSITKHKVTTSQCLFKSKANLVIFPCLETSRPITLTENNLQINFCSHVCQ